MALALACAILHKKIGRRKCNAFRRKMLKVLQRCHKKNAPITMAPHLLLAAEAMADMPRRRSWDDIQQAYLKAVEVSRQCGGFIFVEAFGYEKLAKPAETRSDGPKTQFYLHEVSATCTRWGVKVKTIESKERLAVLQSRYRFMSMTPGT